ncbi:hypothetical protein L249_1913 [Ophiocordyceps polyrhachis-furcata BCC 54312]|uniref:Ubiquitination network signaling protein n=1 Tax=Ophiocordyceps polyrhachis-furcata BCC 54312 TaxID=1330021 RepID=A0A367LPV7_9HYPO|nr:hypothetical protein L249_1913 [Ophiocordyceps polyrhachis-furcata BCC 54312]
MPCDAGSTRFGSANACTHHGYCSCVTVTALIKQMDDSGHLSMQTPPHHPHPNPPPPSPRPRQQAQHSNLSTLPPQYSSIRSSLFSSAEAIPLVFLFAGRNSFTTVSGEEASNGISGKLRPGLTLPWSFALPVLGPASDLGHGLKEKPSDDDSALSSPSPASNPILLLLLPSHPRFPSRLRGFGATRSIAHSGKRQLGAGTGHRDVRHDNGSVGIGRRISANKNCGFLNGSTVCSDSYASLSQPPSPPSLPPPSSLAPNGLVNGANQVKKRPDDAAVPPGLDLRPGHALRRRSLDAYSETSSESCLSSLGPGPEGGHRQIDVNAMKNADVHRDSGPLDLAATVVRSLPVQDTLAILIILMHIPYLSLTLVYACFASLTFVPPVATRVGWNISFGEIIDGNSHAPSLVTAVCMDFFFFLIWVFLWPPIQDSILEFAKPVIAVTLGGGTSAKNGTSQGVTACFAWVLLHKLVRASKRYWPRLAYHLPDAWRVRVVLDGSLSTAATATTSAPTLHAPYDKRDTHGWIQSVLAIHILTQGIVRYIREWYLRRERFHAAAGLGDPEAAKSSAVAGGSNASGAGDSAQDANSNAAPDAETALSSHSVGMIKKRRKQNAQVRLQQPLWSALASSKIVVMKEMELSSWCSSSSDKRDIHNAGNMPFFDRQPRQIWISYIGSDEVCFSTSHFPETADEEPSCAAPAGVDTMKPFYVRINEAYWQPTRIFPTGDGKWSGDIYALRPSSKYVCEFVHVQTDQVLFTTSIRTIKEPLRDDDVSSPGQSNGQQPLRPDSPATTLRTSIVAAESRLADERNRLKTWRKEWKIRINTLKKENELAENQLSTAGNNDERYRQKIRQQETQKAQTERDTRRLSDQLKQLDEAWPELVERKKKVERAFSAEKRIFDATQKELKEHKSQLAKDIKAKEAERCNLNARRNKIASRIAKIDTELANISDSNSRGQGEAERRRQERSRWLEQASAVEHGYTERLAQQVAINHRRREHLRELQARLHSMQSYSLKPANGMKVEANASVAAEAGPASFRRTSPWNASPLTAANYPWATPAPEAMGSRAPNMAARLSSAASPAFDNARGARTRVRSSSMLSDVSGFTQASDEGSVRQRVQQASVFAKKRNGSSGGGSSSDSATG